MTLRQAVHDFIALLQLTPSESEDASRQHTYLREGLSQRLDLDPNHNTFLTGSYARKTAIRPLKDIDMFCVLKRTADQHPNVLTPAAALALVKEALDGIYSGKVSEPQNRSVNIEFSGTGIGYDVVPAFVDLDAPDEVFRIPDLTAGDWIRSNPKVHRDMSVEANDAAGSEIKPLTKAIKHWNRRFDKGSRLRSFHIEVMAWDVLTAPPVDRLEGLVTLFEGLSDRVLRRTPDPAGLGPDIDADLTWSDRQDAAKRFRDAASDVKRAKDLARDGQSQAAHYILYTLFGDPYPEKGEAPPAKSPSVVSPAFVPPAPDGHGSRFG